MGEMVDRPVQGTISSMCVRSRLNLRMGVVPRAMWRREKSAAQACSISRAASSRICLRISASWKRFF